MKLKRLFCALLIGSGVTFSPGLIAHSSSDSGMIGALKWACSYVAIPGVFVGWIAAGGRTDDVSVWIMNIGNLVFYWGLAYFVLTLLGKPPDEDSGIPKVRV